MAKLLFIGVLQCLAVLRCCELFSSGKIEHQIGKCRLCENLDTEDIAGREKDAAVCIKVVTSSSCK